MNTIKSSLNNSFETRVWERKNWFLSNCEEYMLNALLGRQIRQWTKSSQDACKDWDEVSQSSGHKMQSDETNIHDSSGTIVFKPPSQCFTRF